MKRCGDRAELEKLVEDALYLQYRWELMRRTAMLRSDSDEYTEMLKSDSDEYLEKCMDSVSLNFDRLIDSVVGVPASGLFSRKEKKKNWWEVG